MRFTNTEIASVCSTVILTIISLVMLEKTNISQEEVEKWKKETQNNRKAIEVLAIEYVKLDAKCRYDEVWRGQVAEKAESKGVMLPIPPLVKIGD